MSGDDEFLFCKLVLAAEEAHGRSLTLAELDADFAPLAAKLATIFLEQDLALRDPVHPDSNYAFSMAQLLSSAWFLGAYRAARQAIRNGMLTEAQSEALLVELGRADYTPDTDMDAEVLLVYRVLTTGREDTDA